MNYRFNTDLRFSIESIETCDFSMMEQVSNEDVLNKSGKPYKQRLLNYFQNNIGIENRYYCKAGETALDLARSAVAKLVEKQPNLKHEADFFIYIGVSNPYPAVTLSAWLCDEYGFSKASCWDIKSGCSSAVLGFLQALSMIQLGAKKGVIVAAENLSRFVNPKMVQMSMSVGDGACALVISNEPSWKVLAANHGTDATGSGFMRVDETFPNPVGQLTPFYQFKDKPKAVALLQQYWLQSLQTVLEESKLNASDVKHYIAHQIDPEKNALIASVSGIEDSVVASNFKYYGNMGSPTVFINYAKWLEAHSVNAQDKLVFHAVGGGISWAAVALEKL